MGSVLVSANRKRVPHLSVLLSLREFGSRGRNWNRRLGRRGSQVAELGMGIYVLVLQIDWGFVSWSLISEDIKGIDGTMQE